MRTLLNRLVCELVYLLAAADRYTDSDTYANYFIGQKMIGATSFSYQWYDHKPTCTECWLITFKGRTLFMKIRESQQ